MSIKPIETRYKGYRFRSRLEARWAVFFDDCGLEWAYEPEGFVLPGNVPYLPDFRITSPQGLITWYEVKAKGAASDSKMPLFQDSRKNEREKAMEEGCDPGPMESYFTLEGDPWDVWETHRICPRCGTFLKRSDFVKYSADGVWASCWDCDISTPVGSGDEEQGIFCLARPHKGLVIVDYPDDVLAYKEGIESANNRARSARFEHGERP